MAILRRYTPLVEPISIDEAFLDVTGSAALFGDGPTIARRIKDETRAEVGLTASVGVATTKLVAKIASDLRKPDGLVVVAAGDEAAFLAPLADRPAVGRRREDGARAVRIRRPDHRRPRGAPARPRRPPVRQARGVARRTSARARWRPRPRWRPGEIGRPRAHLRRRHQRPRGHRADPAGDGRRGRRHGSAPPGVKAGTIAVKIRDSGFHTITRQRTLAEPTDMTDPIYAAALDLARPEIRGMKVRLLGVQASNLGEREQLALFETTDPRAPAGGRGCRFPAPSIWRAGGHPRPAGRDRTAGAVRARPAQPARSAGAGRPVRARGPAATVRRMPRNVTAKVTRTSTIFRPTTLDIEHLFGLVSSP